MERNKEEYEDINLEKLFNDFSPELKSDFFFMQKLEKNMQSVEMIKSKNHSFLIKNKRAASWAAFWGFLAGILSTLVMPIVIDLIKNLISQISFISMSNSLFISQMLGYMLITLITLFATYKSYVMISSSSD